MEKESKSPGREPSSEGSPAQSCSIPVPLERARQHQEEEAVAWDPGFATNVSNDPGPVTSHHGPQPVLLPHQGMGWMRPKSLPSPAILCCQDPPTPTTVGWTASPEMPYRGRGAQRKLRRAPTTTTMHWAIISGITSDSSSFCKLPRLN